MGGSSESGSTGAGTSTSTNDGDATSSGEPPPMPMCGFPMMYEGPLMVCELATTCTVAVEPTVCTEPLERPDMRAYFQTNDGLGHVVMYNGWDILFSSYGEPLGGEVGALPLDVEISITLQNETTMYELGIMFSSDGTVTLSSLVVL